MACVMVIVVQKKIDSNLKLQKRPAFFESSKIVQKEFKCIGGFGGWNQ